LQDFALQTRGRNLVGGRTPARCTMQLAKVNLQGQRTDSKPPMKVRIARNEHGRSFFRKVQRQILGSLEPAEATCRCLCAVWGTDHGDGEAESGGGFGGNERPRALWCLNHDEPVTERREEVVSGGKAPGGWGCADWAIRN
jgi:hypothetical protein